MFFWNANSQYRGRINDLLFDGGDYEQLPKEYKFLSNEIRKFADLIYYQNMRHSTSNYGTFTSLTLIFHEDFNFNFLNTGFEFRTKADEKLFGVDVSLISTDVNGTWKGRFVTDFDDYNPLNNIKNFFYVKHFLNITDEQLLAHFINNAGSYSSKLSNLDAFIKDVEKANNIKLDKNLIEKSERTLKELCSQINKQMPNSDCGFAAYRAYIQNSDDSKTIRNIDEFYRGFSNQSLGYITDNFILPRGDISFYDKKLQLNLPNKFFFKNKEDDKSNINFYIKKISHQLTYDFEKKTYVLVVKLSPYENSLSSDFKFIGEYQSPLKSKKTIEAMSVKKENLKELELLIYPFEIQTKVKFIKKDEVYSNMFSQEIILKHIFKLK